MINNVYFHRIAQAYNPNTIDYYKVAGHWITQEEDQQRKKYERNIKFTMYALTICINFAVGYLTLTYYL